MVILALVMRVWAGFWGEVVGWVGWGVVGRGRGVGGRRWEVGYGIWDMGYGIWDMGNGYVVGCKVGGMIKDDIAMKF